MSYTREQDFVRTQAKPLKPKVRQHQGHFDPEELSRRLYVVLADQKAHAERKRARAEEAKLKEARSRAGRHQSKEPASASERGSKEVARDQATAPSSSKPQPSRKPPGSSSSGEAKRQKSPNASAQRKETKTHPAKETPRPTPEPPGAYHHVPKEAAKQFTRTTTVDGMREGGSPNLAHILSKQALKLHLAAGAPSSSLRPAADDAAPISPIDLALARSQRATGHHSHPSHDPNADTADPDTDREEYHLAPQSQPPSSQYTFHAELARLRPAPPAAEPGQYLDPHHLLDPQQQRRNSTGDILARGAAAAADDGSRLSMVLPTTTDRPAALLLADVLFDPSGPPPDADEHRVDWTQSDEQAAAAAAAAVAGASASASAAPTAAAGAPSSPGQQAQRHHHHHKPLLSPLLRKADSIWMLRGRLGSGAGGAKGGGGGGGGGGPVAVAVAHGKAAPSQPPIPESPPKSANAESREPKAGFFAKFKR